MKRLIAVLSILIGVSMLLGACAPAATPAPTAMPAPTTAPAAPAATPPRCTPAASYRCNCYGPTNLPRNQTLFISGAAWGPASNLESLPNRELAIQWEQSVWCMKPYSSMIPFWPVYPLAGGEWNMDKSHHL